MSSLEIASAGIAILVATAKMRKKRGGAIDARKRAPARRLKQHLAYPNKVGSCLELTI
ncbi:hypothetical protein LGM43_26425 [Burkholderia seminalis]|uniref:hypothetical protein n=1 Tax=Burkholderia seminalis TaxID=488731 RepID=UPI001CF39903|nr:hypothetical protein [Burkholderia seminalis]MCA7953808.1 hypothetical protein [Burkholderia seminalis]